MSQPPSPPPQSAGAEAAAERIERQKEMLAHLRSLPSSAYITMATAEATAASVVFSPILLALFTLDGAIYARNPVVIPGQPVPPRPQTFGGLLAAGFKSGAGMTFRTIAWTAATAALSAAGKEQLKLGPRYVDGPQAAWVPQITAINGLAGALAGYAVSADFVMLPSRRMLYTLLASGCGVALPAAIAVAGPFVRAQLRSLSGSG